MKISTLFILSALLVVFAGAIPAPDGENEPGGSPNAISEDNAGDGGPTDLTTLPPNAEQLLTQLPKAEDADPEDYKPMLGQGPGQNPGEIPIPDYTVGKPDEPYQEPKLDLPDESCSPVKQVTCVETSISSSTGDCPIKPQCGDSSMDCFAPGKPFGLINDRMNVCMKVVPHKTMGQKLKGLFTKVKPSKRLAIVKCSRDMVFKSAGPHTFAWEQAGGNGNMQATQWKLVNLAWEDGKIVKYYAVRRKYATYFYQAGKTDAASKYTASATSEPNTFQIYEHERGGNGKVNCLTANPFYSRVTSRSCGKSKCFKQQLWQKVQASEACARGFKYEEDKKDYGECTLEGYSNDGKKEDGYPDISGLPSLNCDTPTKQFACDESTINEVSGCPLKPTCGDGDLSCFKPERPFGLRSDRVGACMTVRPFLSLGQKFLNLFRKKANEKPPALRLVTIPCSKHMMFKTASSHTFMWQPAKSNGNMQAQQWNLIHLAWDCQAGQIRRFGAVRRKYATFFMPLEECDGKLTGYTVSQTSDKNLFQIYEHAKNGNGKIRCLTINPFFSRVTSQECKKTRCYRQQLWKQVAAKGAPSAAIRSKTVKRLV